MVRIMKKRVFSRAGLLLLSAALAVVPAVSAFAEASSPVYRADDLFSKRDLRQEAKLSKAVSITLSDGQDVTVGEAGVYVLTGHVSDMTVFVEAGKDDKVQLVLDDVSITNADFPCIYVRSADKVFVTTSADSSLAVTGKFRAEETRTPDGVIYSRDDLVLNGTAALSVESTDNGVVSKDDLKVTGGTYVITAASKCFEANDSIRIAGGTFTLSAGTDAFHAENDDDDALGYVYIGGGSISAKAGDDAVHGGSVIQIDGGDITLEAAEGLEGTRIQLNGGVLRITASDDGMNAADKSKAWEPAVEINGGEITVTLTGSSDTDAIDSNGDIIISGGSVSISGGNAFDYKGTGILNAGTVVIGGEPCTDSVLPNQPAR